MDSLWHAEYGDAFAGRTVLVTGATGFAGHALCEGLVSLGARVHGLARSAEAMPADVRPWSIDLREADRVAAACREISPEYVFHLAAQVTARQELELVRTMLEHNLLGTVNLLLALAHADCRRIVVAGTPEEATDDVRRASVASPYAAAKTGASVYSRMFHRLYRLPIVTVRPFVTYGPWQDESKLVPYTILKLLRGETPQFTSGKRLCDFVFVRDVVRGMLQAALAPSVEGQTFDLGTGRAMSICAAVESIVKLVGRNVPVHFGAIPDRLGEGPLVADADFTRQAIGWEPRWTLESGMAETIAWYAEQIGVTHTPLDERRCA